MGTAEPRRYRAPRKKRTLVLFWSFPRGKRSDEIHAHLRCRLVQGDEGRLRFSRAWELAAAKTGDPAIGLTAPTHPLNSLGVHFCATVLLHGIRWVTGRPVQPIVVHHPAPAPADDARWREAFGCPVHFGATECLIELAAAHLSLPIPTRATRTGAALLPAQPLQPDGDHLRAGLLGSEQLLPGLQALVRPLAGHDAGVGLVPPPRPLR